MTTFQPPPEKWVALRLDQIAEINPPKQTTAQQADTPFAFVPMQAVSEEFGGIDVSTSRPLSEVSKGYTQFMCGDVIMAKITPCMENGKLAIVPTLKSPWAYGSTEFLVVRPKPAASAKWIAFFLSQQSVRRSARANMAGSAGQLRVPKSWLEGLEVPLPPSTEQQRIVAKIEELFSDLDAGVAALERVRAKLKRYRASVLNAAVTGKLTEAWRLAHPPAEPADKLLVRILAERRKQWEVNQLRKFADAGKTPLTGWKKKYTQPVTFRDDDLPKLPADWIWIALDAITAIAGGITKGQRHGADIRLRDVPYLRVANVQRGRLDLREIKTIPATEADIKALRLLKGDILFNEGGDRDKLGRGWVWNDEVGECIHQNHVFRARVIIPELEPKFISHHGNSFGQLWFQRNGKQSVNLASINMGVLRRFPIPLPPIKEQVTIVTEVERLLSVVDAVEAEVGDGLKRATRLRQAILKRAFEGNLVAQDSNEASCVLLDLVRPASVPPTKPTKQSPKKEALNAG